MEPLTVGRRMTLAAVTQLALGLALYPKAFASEPAIPKTVVDSIEHFVADARSRACPGMDARARPSEITQVPLEDHGGYEFLVRPQDDCDCSPTGNCDLWVLIPRGKILRVLLVAGTVQKVDVLQTMSHGHPDLALSGHNSATESTHWTYQFDGKRYLRTECRQWSYQDEKDPDKILQEPRVTPC